MPQPIKLEAVAGDSPVEIATIESGAMSFGREPENSIVIGSEAVSRRHGLISVAGSQWVYRDFGSSNGSWVNGVPVTEGQIRILRDSDLIRVADFPVRVTQIGKPAISAPPLSLLIFYGETYESEFTFPAPDIMFTVGGADASISLEGEPVDTIQLSIERVGSRLELYAEQATMQVIVNGLAVGGSTALADRDEIGVGPFTIVVNDLSGASQKSAGHSVPVGLGFTPEGAPIAAYSQTDVSTHLKGGESTTYEWESQSSRRQNQSEHRFIFGGKTGVDVSGTGRYTTPQFGAHSGYEMSASTRFSNVPTFKRDKNENRSAEKVIMVAGLTVFLLVVGLIGYLISIQ